MKAEAIARAREQKRAGGAAADDVIVMSSPAAAGGADVIVAHIAPVADITGVSSPVAATAAAAGADVIVSHTAPVADVIVAHTAPVADAIVPPSPAHVTAVSFFYNLLITSSFFPYHIFRFFHTLAHVFATDIFFWLLSLHPSLLRKGLGSFSQRTFLPLFPPPQARTPPPSSWYAYNTHTLVFNMHSHTLVFNMHSHTLYTYTHAIAAEGSRFILSEEFPAVAPSSAAKQPAR